MAMSNGKGQSEAALPLKGVTVVEIGNSVAAPFAGLILAQLGAEVVKVRKCPAGAITPAIGGRLTGMVWLFFIKYITVTSAALRLI